MKLSAREKAENVLRWRAEEMGFKHFEIVESTYLYSNGLTLIAYETENDLKGFNSDCREIDHITVNIDDYEKKVIPYEVTKQVDELNEENAYTCALGTVYELKEMGFVPDTIRFEIADKWEHIDNLRFSSMKVGNTIRVSISDDAHYEMCALKSFTVSEYDDSTPETNILVDIIRLQELFKKRFSDFNIVIDHDDKYELRIASLIYDAKFVRGVPEQIKNYNEFSVEFLERILEQADGILFNVEKDAIRYVISLATSDIAVDDSELLNAEKQIAYTRSAIHRLQKTKVSIEKMELGNFDDGKNEKVQNSRKSRIYKEDR